MKKFLILFLTILLSLSLTACGNKSNNSSFKNDGLQSESDSEEETVYYVSEEIWAPSGSGIISRFYISGNYIYFSAVKRDNTFERKPISNSIWKKALDNDEYERLDIIPEGYYLESFCVEDERIGLLLSCGGEFFFCEYKEGDQRELFKLELNAETSGNMFIAYDEDMLVVWEQNISLFLFDYKSGGKIKSYENNPESHFIQICENKGTKYALISENSKTNKLISIENLVLDNDKAAIEINHSIFCMGYTKCEGEEIILSDWAGLMSMNKNSAKYEQLLSWDDAGLSISFGLSMPTMTDEGEIYITDLMGCIKKLEQKLVPKRKPISIMSYAPGGMTSDLISKFNLENNEFKIKYISPIHPDLLKTKIITGNGPDIICLDHSYGKIFTENEDVFMDFMPMLKSDETVNIADLYENVLESSKNGGDSLLYFPTTFSINILVLPYTGKDLVVFPSFEEFEKLIENAGSARSGWELNAIDFFKAALPVIEKDALLGEKGSRQLDIELIRKWLLLSEKAAQHNIVVYNIVSPQWYAELKNTGYATAGRVSIVGFPGKRIGGPYVDTNIGTSFVVLNSCQSKEQAWDFVRSSVFYDNKGWSFSINRKTTEQDIDGTRRLMEVKKMKFTDSEVSELKELLNSIRIVANPDPSLQNIILEEAEAYFSGQRDIEKTVELIENRTNILISERGL